MKQKLIISLVGGITLCLLSLTVRIQAQSGHIDCIDQAAYPFGISSLYYNYFACGAPENAVDPVWTYTFTPTNGILNSISVKLNNEEICSEAGPITGPATCQGDAPDIELGTFVVTWNWNTCTGCILTIDLDIDYSPGPTPTPTVFTPTPTPDRYVLIRSATEITDYYHYQDLSTLTGTLTLPSIDYTALAGYILTYYDFFKNASKILYVLPFLFAFKFLSWLYNYTTGLRVGRDNQFEVDFSGLVEDERSLGNIDVNERLTELENRLRRRRRRR